MPPRIPLGHAARCCNAFSETRPPSQFLVSLFAGLSLQTRNAHILASLSDNKGAYSKRIRKGRGPSSGYGKTAGRGHKGQKQHGSVKPWFQGGQTPLLNIKGRKGFVNKHAQTLSEVNLDRIQEFIDTGRLDPTKRITPKELIDSRLVGSIKDGIKLLGRGAGALKTPIDIVVSRASASAIDAVEAAGGKVLTRYFTEQSIRRLVKGESIIADQPLPIGPEHVESVLQARPRGAHLYRLPDPTHRWDIEYYRDPAHRGYMSHLLQPGQSPSLYFKVPLDVRKSMGQKKSKKEETEDALKLF